MSAFRGEFNRSTQHYLLKRSGGALISGDWAGRVAANTESKGTPTVGIFPLVGSLCSKNAPSHIEARRSCSRCPEPLRLAGKAAKRAASSHHGSQRAKARSIVNPGRDITPADSSPLAGAGLFLRAHRRHAVFRVPGYRPPGFCASIGNAGPWLARRCGGFPGQPNLSWWRALALDPLRIDARPAAVARERASGVLRQHFLQLPAAR